jgi:hypothetical protein
LGDLASLIFNFVDERQFFERSGHSLEFFASFLLQGKKEVRVTGAEAPYQILKCSFTIGKFGVVI